MPQQELGNPDRRAIFIPAVPSSGSSCAAGVLQKLGVSMGKRNHAAWMVQRGYEMYEDKMFWHFGAQYNTDGIQLERVADSHFRIRDYVNYRFINEPEQRCGFKGPAPWFFDDPDPTSLPLDILQVRRPLEDSIKADYMRNQRRQERRADIDSPPDPLMVRLRAGSLATCWMASQQIDNIDGVEPRLAVDYYELVADTERVVGQIAEAFDLEPTSEQFAAAVQFVRPELRTIGG